MATTGGGLLYLLGYSRMREDAWTRSPLPFARFEHEWRRMFSDLDDPAVLDLAAKALEEKREDWQDLPSLLPDLSDRSFKEGIERASARSREDYAAGRIVSVDNWLISRSEAELLAMLRTPG